MYLYFYTYRLVGAKYKLLIILHKYFSKELCTIEYIYMHYFYIKQQMYTKCCYR